MKRCPESHYCSRLQTSK